MATKKDIAILDGRIRDLLADNAALRKDVEYKQWLMDGLNQNITDLARKLAERDELFFQMVKMGKFK